MPVSGTQVNSMTSPFLEIRQSFLKHVEPCSQYRHHWSRVADNSRLYRVDEHLPTDASRSIAATTPFASLVRIAAVSASVVGVFR